MDFLIKKTMYSSSEKTKTHAPSAVRKRGEPAFFRKAGGESFFGESKQPAFFNPVVQAKLTVSSPDDPQEKEADSMADKVMRMPSPVSVMPSKKEEEKLQRKEEEENLQMKPEGQPNYKIQSKEDEEDKVQAKLLSNVQRSPDEQAVVMETNTEPAGDQTIHRKNISIHYSDAIQRSGRGPPTTSHSFEQTLSSSKGSGSALPGETKQFMESRFQADFSNVRIHTNSHAESMSRQINALAFTHGSDVYFNSGKYSPSTTGGSSLLAHELTHTIQQGAVSSVKTAAPKLQAAPDPRINSEKEEKISPKRLPGNKKTETNKIQLSSSVDSVGAGIDLSGKSGGSALPGEAKEYLQDYFKINLNDIRIHADFESALFCKSLGVDAFVQGKNICISPSKYNPESERGAMLLSEQVSKSLKQRGLKIISGDGKDLSDASSVMSQIAAAVKEIKVEESNKGEKNNPVAVPASKLTEKSKDKSGGKSKKDKGKAGDKKSRKKGKRKKDDSDGPSIKPVKRNPKKSPASPAEDPAFLAVIKKTKSTAKKQKQHEAAEKKSTDAQNNAAAVPKEAESKAQNRKTDGMGEAAKEDKPFDAKSFKADLLKKIEEVTPKTLEAATKFKQNNKIDGVKNVMGEKMATEKTNTVGPVDKATEMPLQVNEADNKKPLPLPPTDKGARPSAAGSKDAAPKNKLPGEITMQEQSKSLDDEMKANKITEGQLMGSNEPTFKEAVNEKKKAQKDAVEKPKQYQKEEALILKEAKSTVQEDSAKTLSSMHGTRGKNFDATVKEQKTTKQKDEEKRAKVSLDIETIYTKSETTVNTELKAADDESNRIFDEGAEAARIEFENYVDQKMSDYKRRRYSGFWGGLRWAKDKLFGMPDAVNKFYVDGRKMYLDKMDKVITQVADAVTLHLNAAKNAITEGKKEIDDYVKKLPKELEDFGKEAASTIQDKFDSLEQNVNDKRNDLIDGLAKKYVDNVKKMDERINELKEANKGLIDKAIGFLKKVWKVIKDLVNLFTTILARLASIVGIIIGSPGGFFDNLGKAFKKGFNQFKDKFLEYLEKGLMDWLATNLGIAGLELPEKFTPASILSLVLQVMGITKAHIKERAIAILGPRKVALLESAGGILYRVYNEGLGALWDMIQEKLTDLKEIVWEAIKSFIKTKIIEAAITFLLSLLNPIGAFIKVCMAIYDFLMMLVRFKDRIIELLDTILNAVTDVASGAIDGAANAIEKAFAKSIPIIIAFLAALLHLNDIAVKVKGIITKIRARIDKAIDFVIKKAYSLVGKVVEGALKMQDKGMAMVEKGKQAAIGAGKKLKDKITGKEGEQKKDGKENTNDFQEIKETIPFDMGEEKHELTFSSKNGKAEISMASDLRIILPVYLSKAITQVETMPHFQGKKRIKDNLVSAKNLSDEEAIQNYIEDWNMNKVKGTRARSLPEFIHEKLLLIAEKLKDLVFGEIKVPAVVGIYDILRKNTKKPGHYAGFSDPLNVAPFEEFSSTQRSTILIANSSRNSGKIVSDCNPVEVLHDNDPNDSLKANIDHIYPRSKGGSNSYSNAQVISRADNLKKSDTMEGCP